MTPTAFENLVSQMKSRYPFWFEGEREEPASPQELKAFEAKVKCKLPEEFHYFAQRHGFGNFAFASILSIRQSERDILKLRKLLPEGYLPVSDNGCGDFYAFKSDNDNCSKEIYFLDHEQEYAGSRTEYEDFFEFIVHIGFKHNSR